MGGEQVYYQTCWTCCKCLFYLAKVFVTFLCFRAVVDHSVGKDLPSVSVERFEYFPGRGLVATLNSIEVMFFISIYLSVHSPEQPLMMKH